jgi:3-methyladenine DNA glycosylase AlkC
MSEYPALKDGFADPVLRTIAGAVSAAHPGFRTPAFLRDCRDGFEALSLMQRVRRVGQALHTHLPKRFDEALEVVERALGAPRDGWNEGEGIAAFARAPYLEWAALAGLGQPQQALPALARLTRHFSAEFAIRPFLAQHLEPTLAHLAQWVSDADPRVRRLASEGSRPLLPWGQHVAALKRDPQRCLALIEPLASDADEVVRRSAANHLNDVSRLDAGVALDHARRWQVQGGEAAGTVRHGLRTLVKAGHPEALALQGYGVGTAVRLKQLRLSSRRVAVGEVLDLSFALHNPNAEPVRVCVDYAIVYASARGTPRRKVFKGSDLVLAPGEKAALVFRRDFVPRSTRVLYPGVHQAEVLVNGQVAASANFTLVG